MDQVFLDLVNMIVFGLMAVGLTMFGIVLVNTRTK